MKMMKRMKRKRMQIKWEYGEDVRKMLKEQKKWEKELEEDRRVKRKKRE